MFKSFTLFWTVVTLLFGVRGSIPATPPVDPAMCEHEYSLVAVEVPETCAVYRENEYPYIKGIKAELRCGICGHSEDVSSEIKSDGEMITRDAESFTVTYGDYECSIPVTVTPIWRVAFCGDSITAGLADKSIYQYSTYVGKFLSRKTRIMNFGVGGTSITGYGGNWNDPGYNYRKQEVFENCVKSNPDLVIIMLGSNDASQWQLAKESFESDYRELITSFRERLPDAQIVIATSPPTAEGNAFGILNSVISNDIVPIEKKLAEEFGLSVIDVNGIINERGLEGMYVDGVHIKDDGVLIMARIMTEPICEIFGLEPKYGTFFD